MELKINEYIMNVETLKAKFKWKMNISVISFISLGYVLNHKKLDVDELSRVSQQISKQVGMFSPFRSYLKYSVAAFIITKFNDPQERIKAVFEIFNQMKAHSMPNNAYTVISALSLLKEYQSGIDLTTTILKIKEVYQGMKRKHFFLTSHSDYPLATLLSFENKDTKQLMNEIEDYYVELSQQDFKKGNDLQFLSHIMMLIENNNKNQIISKAGIIKSKLLNYNIIVKPLHYSVIGLLCALELYENDYIELYKIVEQLNQHKYLKTIKNINVILATMLFVSEMVDDAHILETYLTTTIESIIEAQNAAMIVTVSIASASAAN